MANQMWATGPKRVTLKEDSNDGKQCSAEAQITVAISYQRSKSSTTGESTRGLFHTNELLGIPSKLGCNGEMLCR
ncbi:hypothetical protein GX48_04150 [Paracoccidioides brasiliensis]|nr:hypothetical protein GX48_04150 [Paracoccidioides brasiliensis]